MTVAAWKPADHLEAAWACLKIGKELGVGTGLVQGIVHPFEASAA
jgi:hypothetical protein